MNHLIYGFEILDFYFSIKFTKHWFISKELHAELMLSGCQNMFENYIWVLVSGNVVQGVVGEVKMLCILCQLRAPNWYWFTVGLGLLSLLQVRVDGEYTYFFCFVTFFHFPLPPLSLFHLLYYLFYLFSFCLGDDTKCPQRLTCR